MACKRRALFCFSRAALCGVLFIIGLVLVSPDLQAQSSFGYEYEMRQDEEATEPDVMGQVDLSPVLPEDVEAEDVDPELVEDAANPFAPGANQPPAEPHVTIRGVKLRGLNKITAKTEIIEAPVGIVKHFGNLEIVARKCWKSPPTEQPENAALLDIWEHKVDEAAPQRVFTGWMFASSPSLSTMEHPVYDITVLECVVREETQAP